MKGSYVLFSGLLVILSGFPAYSLREVYKLPERHLLWLFQSFARARHVYVPFDKRSHNSLRKHVTAMP